MPIYRANICEHLITTEIRKPTKLYTNISTDFVDCFILVISLFRTNLMARIAYGSVTAQGLSLTERPKCLAKLGIPQRLVALFVRDNHAEYHKTATQ